MIDFGKYYDLVQQFLSNNILIAIALGIAIIVSLYKKPEGTIKFLAFCAFLVVVIYIMSLLSESGSFGVEYKQSGIEKSESVLRD